MKAVIVQRYNGWEISEESGGPLVKFEDVREVVEQHDELVRELATAEKYKTAYFNLTTIRANVNNEGMSDAEFRDFLRTFSE